MKNIFLFLLFFVILNGYSQTKMQGTIKPGVNPGTIDIYVKPSATFSQKDEAMTFALAIPANVLPAPSLGASGTTINGTGAVTGVTGMQPNFLVNNLGSTLREVVITNETINGNSYYIYTFIFSGTASTDHSWTAGVEQQLFSIAFNPCTLNCNINSVKLVNLANGGSSNNSYWYFQPNTLGDITNYPAPFYANPYTSAAANGGSSNGSALSSISLITPVALPIQLQQFTATVNLCNVNLNWQTQTEINTAYFIIERSNNAGNFTEITKVDAAGNSTTFKSYSFTDVSAPAGNLFYRVRITDKDGKFSYSLVKEVNLNCSGKNNPIIYPTLTHGIINVVLPAGYINAQIRIIDAVGKEVAFNESNNLTRAINMKQLQNGTYIVQVINDGKMITNVKVILQQ